MNFSLRFALLVAITCLACFQTVLCASSDSEVWITYESPNGQTLYLRDNRRPSLYTGNYGDCLGSSLVNVTRFDAAYYKDNMTVLFHLAGNTAIHNESLVMYIGVYAYGESRFDLIFNPCNANIASLCPLNSSVPISANGIIPIAESDVSTIPPIALKIPDFEGQAILRIFANSTQSEIGCYSAVVTNGYSFAQPKFVGSALGIFTVIAMVASFSTAIYGEAVPTMRLHYAHSLSVGVVFAVFQHIYFTGALSMNWPSVLVAWWHNFAWSGGMIYVESMQNDINRLIGNVIGNTSQVGAAPSDSGNVSVGGGYDINQIYKRGVSSLGLLAELPGVDLASEIYKDANSSEMKAFSLTARDNLPNKTDGYRWYGRPIGPGMPLPGNYSGFSGTLAEENIRISNAFMTGFLWFLILLALLVTAVFALKWTLEALAYSKAIRLDRLKFFRDHWIGCATVVALRTCYIGFFLIMFLTFFEFSIQSSAKVKVVATLVFLFFLAGIPGAAAYACYSKKHLTKGGLGSPVERKTLLRMIPWAISSKAGADIGNGTALLEQIENEAVCNSMWRRMLPSKEVTNGPAVVDDIHNNDDYIMKFGWLVSRFRRTRWWFFTFWLFYESVRAVFYAGASGYPLAQVFSLLTVEVLAFVYIIWSRPFEGRRLNIIVVYCLGFSKVSSVALSVTFDVQFNLPRITTTVIGIGIIAIQGILAIISLIAIIVGAISSYMSICRNHEDFRPRKWHGLREKYFDYLDRVANDLPRQQKPKKWSKRNSTRASEQRTGFEIKGIKRIAKIEDEDSEFATEMRNTNVDNSYFTLEDQPVTAINSSTTAVGSERSRTATPLGRSRAASLQSISQANLPYGARQHRASWNARDFGDFNAFQSGDAGFMCVAVNERLVDEEYSANNTIDNIPPPTIRPRSGTIESLRSSRPSSPGFESSEESDDNELYPSRRRSNKYRPQMSPAQELEERSNSSKST